MKTRVLLALACSILAGASATRAGILDLTTLGASGAINDAVFTQGNSHIAGTGYVDSFLRLQAEPTEQGYNTSGNPVPFDGKNSFVRDLPLATVGVVSDGAGNYFAQLLLDINQSNDSSRSQITLNKFQIYLTTTPSQTTTSFLPNGDLDLADAIKVYDIDQFTDNSVLLDARLQQGSGTRDMTVDLPAALFLSADAATNYFVLYAEFGDPSNPNSGFEEFWYDKGTTYTFGNPPPVVPEPAALSLLGLGAVALLARRTRR